MRCAFMVPVAGILLSLSVTPASARDPLTIDDDLPQSMSDVRSKMGKIGPYLEASQCGGWNFSESVAGKVATVTGVPGHNGQWDGAITSGMATRTGDYVFPGTVQGFATGCWDGMSQVTKYIWNEGLHRRVAKKYGYPYYLDPGCRWRLKSGTTVNPPPYAKSNFEELKDANGKVPLSPEVCQEFCPYLNSWKYWDCLQEIPQFDADGNFLYFTCPAANYGYRYICTDAPVKASPSCAPGSAATLRNPDFNTGNLPNAQGCTGNDCRCPAALHTGGPNGCITPDYYSYYRRYNDVNYARDPVPDVSSDVANKSAEVACYGYYWEFDPKTRQTHAWDRRCVINIDVTEMRDTQEGKGEYGRNSRWPDPDPDDPANQRDANYDQDDDLWYENLAAGFALLNEKVFKRDYEQNLSLVYSATDSLDQSQMLAKYQMKQSPPSPGETPVENENMAKSSTIRSFDDTGLPRTIVTWWQKLQNEVSALAHPPVVRLMLPPSWAFGVDPNDPLFGKSDRKNLQALDKREERVEVQIDADEDFLGAVLAYLERSLILRLQEEPIPILVPLGSPTEFRAKAEAWCMWYIQKSNEQTCDNAPDEVKALMERLLAYADQIEDVRLLRANLAEYAVAILKTQQEIMQPISIWMEDSLTRYRDYLQKQKAAAQQITNRWRGIQETFADFASKTNRPWCMNQRFTIPVYSLLDEWLPTRVTDGSVTNDTTASPLPSLTIPRPEDIIMDLSKISTRPDTVIKLPVLKPIQIRITNIPSPPPVSDDHGLTDEDALPALPNMTDIQLAIHQALQALPKLETNPFADPPPPLNLPEPTDATALLQGGGPLEKIDFIVADMSHRYDMFWQSIGPFDPATAASERPDPRSHTSMKEALECNEWADENPPLCQHVELDLIERFTRIASRPDVQLKEDYESQGPEQMFSTCNPMDHVCTPVHPEAEKPTVRWEVLGPSKQGSYIEELRRMLRLLTLPTPVGSIEKENLPHYDTDINELLPSFGVPTDIRLFEVSGSTLSIP